MQYSDPYVQPYFYISMNPRRALWEKGESDFSQKNLAPLQEKHIRAANHTSESISTRLPEDGI